jgi:hypothetical protein
VHLARTIELQSVTPSYSKKHLKGQPRVRGRTQNIDSDQLLFMRQTLMDFGYNLSKVPLICDNESATHLVNNPVEHNRTKHVDIQHHFLRDHQ